MAAMVLPWGLRSNAQMLSRGHFAITAQQVAETISFKGVRVTDQQVSLLANVVAVEPHPALDILSVELLGDQPAGQPSQDRTIVKMACHRPGTCLPFYAIVSLPAAAAPASAGKSGGSAQRIAALKPSAEVAMRAGTRATLVMNDDRTHIQVAVVSLENGAVGRKIRVASPDHKQVYLAEVVNAHLLKRSF
jgi:hypothetical protein